MTEIFVTPNMSGTRLDKCLAEQLHDISRSKLKNIITAKQVKIDGDIIADPAYKIKENQTIVIDTTIAPVETDLKPANIALDIIYEDDDIAVINKPAGMTTHPGAGQHQDTLANALLGHFQNLSSVNGADRPGIVHRLDKDTSGLLVIAKNDHSHTVLQNQLASRKLSRVYVAICFGVIKPFSGIITGNIARAKHDRTRMRIVREGGKEAETHYETLETFSEVASLVECKLATGRTHQIRIHLSNLGHSIIGDQKYGSSTRKINRSLLAQNDYISNFKRQALHAKKIGFHHPRSSDYLQFEIELADDIKELIDNLRSL